MTHISGQLSQDADAARKAVEIKQGWQASVWKKLLAAYEEARPLAIEAQKRQLGELESKIVTGDVTRVRSEEHTSELQSLMRIPYAVLCLKNKKQKTRHKNATKQ